jgi:hypothetical protein
MEEKQGRLLQIHELESPEEQLFILANQSRPSIAFKFHSPHPLL